MAPSVAAIGLDGDRRITGLASGVATDDVLVYVDPPEHGYASVSGFDSCSSSPSAITCASVSFASIP